MKIPILIFCIATLIGCNRFVDTRTLPIKYLYYSEKDSLIYYFHDTNFVDLVYEYKNIHILNTELEFNKRAPRGVATMFVDVMDTSKYKMVNGSDYGGLYKFSQVQVLQYSPDSLYAQIYAVRRVPVRTYSKYEKGWVFVSCLHDTLPRPIPIDSIYFVAE